MLCNFTKLLLHLLFIKSLGVYRLTRKSLLTHPEGNFQNISIFPFFLTPGISKSLVLFKEKLYSKIKHQFKIWLSRCLMLQMIILLGKWHWLITYKTCHLIKLQLPISVCVCVCVYIYIYNLLWLHILYSWPQ